MSDSQPKHPSMATADGIAAATYAAMARAITALRDVTVCARSTTWASALDGPTMEFSRGAAPQSRRMN